jgi:hypothetical protein
MEEAKHVDRQANATLDNKGASSTTWSRCAQGRRIHAGPRERRPDGRVAEAARLGRRLADPVPRERRRQPRADGLEHAASGRAAGARRGAVRRHRHGRGRGARLRRRDRPRRGGVSTRSTPPVSSSARRRETDPASRASTSTTPAKFQRSNQNTCINQRPLVKVGDQVASRRHHRRRSVDRSGRTGARPERARRVHAVERLQLRRLDPDLRAHRQGRRLHLDPHRGIRGHGARHQARAGRNHPRHPERRRRSAEEPRRSRHRLHRRRSAGGRHPGRQDHAEGRKPDDAGRKAAARHLRRKGLRRARHLAASAAGRERHGRRSARVQPPRRRQGRARAWRSSARKSSALAKDRDDEQAHPRPQRLSRLAMLLVGKVGNAGPKGFKKGTQDHAKRGARASIAFAVVAVRRRRRRRPWPSSKP